ncbi:MAG: NEW3 domain-containing protein [Candidatus Aenigmatarchaeota archaeon]
MKPENLRIAGRRSALLLAAAVLSVCVFLATATNCFSYEYYSKYGVGLYAGEIVDMTVIPAKPKVFEDATVTVTARNLQDQNNEYLLSMFSAKDGQVLDENELTFKINPGKDITVSIAFSPTRIGKYTIVAKLYDKYKSVLYSERVLDVEVVSEIGPFDVQLDVLSRNIRPGYEIPLLISLKHMGMSGTDVKVSVYMDCADGGRYKDFSVFVDGGGKVDKTFSIQACEQEGYHEITAKVVMFDSVLAQSTGNVFIRESQKDIYVRAPDRIEARKGSSKVFDVYVRNDYNITVHNLKLALVGLPEGWLYISPGNVASIDANESALFVVNMTIPADAAAIEYPLVVSVGCDETLTQKESMLKVLQPGAVYTRPAGEALPYDSALLKAAAVVIVVAVAAVVVWHFRNMRVSGARKTVLAKVKDMIRANE